jgi:hypothetical protein
VVPILKDSGHPATASELERLLFMIEAEERDAQLLVENHLSTFKEACAKYIR